MGEGFRVRRSTPMLICFNDWDGDILCGEILHHQLSGPVDFEGERDLIVKIHDIGRWIGVSSGGKEEGQERNFCPQKEERPWPLSGYPAERPKESFYLELLARQDQSLKGRIRSRRLKEKMVYFRSSRELTKIIREALGLADASLTQVS